MHKNKDLWLRKIAAFLHDPPNKAMNPKQRRNIAREIIQEVFEPSFNYDTVLPDVENGYHQISAASFKYELASLIERLLHEQGRYKKIDSVFATHPLCVTHLNFGDKEHLKKLTDKVKQKIIEYWKNEIDKRKLTEIDKKFLLLWRIRLSAKKWEEWTLNGLYKHLPIDERVIDNSFDEFAPTQSAIVSTVNPQKNFKPFPSFLILEFRPVQKFIANARKTRDLWFSSWLISYLAWKAMKPIAEALGPDNIVYPDLYKQPLVDDWLKGLEIKDIPEPNLRMPTLPNTFLAIVPEGQEKEFAEKSQQALKDAWDEIVDGVYPLLMNAGMLEKGSPLEREFKRQTEQLPFDIYWLGLKWGNNPEKAIEDYRKLLSPDRCWEFGRLWNQIKGKGIKTNIGDTYALLVEMAQTGLKALKYRGRPSFTEEKWQKCSLCGERSALIDLDLDKLESDPNYVNETIKKFRYKFKDDLDEKGRRNALYYKRLKDFWKKMADAFPGHIKENEHLCAVCLVKRLAPKAIYQNPGEFFESENVEFDYHYPSTGSIALAPFVRELLKLREANPEIENAISELEKSLLDLPENFRDAHFTEGRTVPKLGRILDKDKFSGDFEPEWFYDEAFQRFYEELEHRGENGQKHEWAQRIEQAVKQIKDKTKESLGDKYHMPRYYAAVYLDGDNLGKWLRGELAPKIEDVFHPDFLKAIYEKDETRKDFEKIKNLKRPVTPAIHRAISSALRDFALEVVPYVVEDNLGVVIYSGGDDTLFLMPLENLFQTLIALRKLYSGERFVGKFGGRRFESNKGFIKIYENDKLTEIIRVMGTKATLSAGVAIAHYLDPLDITLAKAKKALKDAKNAGRNRAGFNVVLHSGKERKAVVPWNFVETMERFRVEVAGGFSPRLLRTLYQYIDVYQDIPDAFDAEFLKFGARGQGEDAEALLCDLIDARRNNDLEPKKFVEALLIADFVVREEGSK